jgi:hypothetical protein
VCLGGWALAVEVEKNLLQPGCKPGCLQPLTKRWIGPTYRSITQLKRYLVDLQVGSILLFVRGCKQPGLQPGCNKFFSVEVVWVAWRTPDGRTTARQAGINCLGPGRTGGPRRRGQCVSARGRGGAAHSGDQVGDEGRRSGGPGSAGAWRAAARVRTLGIRRTRGLLTAGRW